MIGVGESVETSRHSVMLGLFQHPSSRCARAEWTLKQVWGGDEPRRRACSADRPAVLDLPRLALSAQLNQQFDAPVARLANVAGRGDARALSADRLDADQIAIVELVDTVIARGVR
jgi:hypothetical protein